VTRRVLRFASYIPARLVALEMWVDPPKRMRSQAVSISKDVSRNALTLEAKEID